MDNQRLRAQIEQGKRLVEERTKQVSRSNLPPSYDLIGLEATIPLAAPWWTRERRLREVDGIYTKPHLYWS